MQPAVHSIDEFVFSVAELEAARHFYASFGLDVRDEGEGLGLYTFGHPHRWGRVLRSDTKQLLWLSFGVFAEAASGKDLNALFASRAKAGG